MEVDSSNNFDFVQVHELVKECLESCEQEKSVETLTDSMKPLIDQANKKNNIDNDIKEAVNTGFRNLLMTRIASDQKEALENLINISVDAAKAEISSVNLPITLLSDLFEAKTIIECQDLFSLVETRVEVWKHDFFFKSIRNQLLRTCNDLLRRLSRSQYTVFCGRILVFLARFFPLFERSGLNLLGEFNRENVINLALSGDEGEDTTLSSVPNAALTETAKDPELEEGEEAPPKETDSKMPVTPAVKDAPVIIDYDLYLKFWQLQDYFRNPDLLYDANQWDKFTTNSNHILTALYSLKLDASLLSKEESTKNPETMYFAKYLTNQKLLELQLSDSNFRRYILLQFLIMFQYLMSTVKFKTEDQVLSDEQKDFVKETTGKVYELISQTPPNGSEMSRIIRQIMSREESWSSWKNDGCKEVQTFERQKPKIGGQTTLRKRRAGDDVVLCHSTGKHSLGNKELTRLWNLCPDNWEACSSKKRVFTPNVDEYFEEIVKESKDHRLKTVTGDPAFTWKGLRLLSQRSNLFLAHSNVAVRPVYAYMDSVLDNLSTTIPVNQVEEPQIKEETAMDTEDVSDEEFLKMPEDNSQGSDSRPGSPKQNGKTDQPVNQEVIDQVKATVTPIWKRLAKSWTFENDEIEFWESQHPGDETSATATMLLIWTQQFPEDATVSRLKECCLKYGVQLSVPQ